MVVEIHMFITVCFLQQRYYRLLLFPCGSRLLLQQRYYSLGLVGAQGGSYLRLCFLQQLKNSLCFHKKRHTTFLLLEVQSTLQQSSSSML